MNKCLLFAGLMSLAFSSTAQVEIFSEDFQQGIPSTWTLINKDGKTPNAVVSEYNAAWISVASPTDLNNNCVSSTSYFEPIGKANRWIITEPITLGQSGNYVSFKAMSFDPSFPDSYSIMISKHLVADSFVNVRTIVLENPEWIERDISLNVAEMQGETVYIAFVNQSEDGFKLFIDDVKVRKDDPLSTQQLDAITASIYPNPTTGKLTITSASSITKVGIYSNEGKLIAEIDSDFQAIDISEFQHGNYLVKVYNGNDFTVKRIIKL